MDINFIMHERIIQKNKMGIVIDKDLKEKIVGVKRLSDRIITIKLVLEEDIIHIISAYCISSPRRIRC